ncbi:hypothetical protein EVAR_15782_1 [Eumeta japonica]|uniref:Uncharacterized protein n=1 Tax=Eumeta variegata TaxID=151549 RepID=A0A4C1U053_EUMVA|nr:hypothetical protein EVAR_15782_1 [Eumeta japonica]
MKSLENSKNSILTPMSAERLVAIGRVEEAGAGRIVVLAHNQTGAGVEELRDKRGLREKNLEAFARLEKIIFLGASPSGRVTDADAANVA